MLLSGLVQLLVWGLGLWAAVVSMARMVPAQGPPKASPMLEPRKGALRRALSFSKRALFIFIYM